MRRRLNLRDEHCISQAEVYFSWFSFPLESCRIYLVHLYCTSTRNSLSTPCQFLFSLSYHETRAAHLSFYLSLPIPGHRLWIKVDASFATNTAFPSKTIGTVNFASGPDAWDDWCSGSYHGVGVLALALRLRGTAAMHFDDADAPHLKSWVVKRLEDM